MLKVLLHNLNKLQSYSLPSDQYVSLTFGAYDTEYTAPADGYFVFSLRANNTTNWYKITVNNVVWYQSCLVGANTQIIADFIPVKKGDVIEIFYNFGTRNYLYFYYSLGSEPQT